MTRVSLINLGDGTRCLYDTSGRIVSIGIGEVVTADFRETTIRSIAKFHGIDTLLVSPEGSAFSPPAGVREALELLKVVYTDPYESVLMRFSRLKPPRGSHDIRPNRGQMQSHLRGLIESCVRSAMDAPSEEDGEDLGQSAETLEQDPHSARPVRRRRRGR